MATFSEQSNTVVDIIQTNHSLSQQLTRTAVDAIEQIAESVKLIELVDPNITTTFSPALSASIPSISAAPDHTTWVSEAVAALPDMPTVPSVTLVIPEYTIDAPTALTGSVGSIPSVTTADFPTIESIGTVPVISAIVPTIDVSALTTAFSYTEPTFTGKISTTIQSVLTGILGGTGILSQAYWDSLTTKLVNGLALERDALLRDASNNGAASWSPMPSEASTVAVQKINDSYLSATLKARIEQALEQQKAAREDLTKALEVGVTYEQLWIEYSNNTAQRALAAAEQSAKIAIEVHNANVARFNLLLEGAKVNLEIDQAGISRALAIHKDELETDGQILDQIRMQVEKYQKEWDLKVRAFDADSNRGAQAAAIFASQVQAWSAQADTEIKVKGFPLEKAKIEASIYQTVNSAVGELAKAVSAISDAYNSGQKLILERGVAAANLEAAHNTIGLDTDKLAVAAKEAMSRYQIANAEWIQGQIVEIDKAYAQLSSGLAGALLTASNVGMAYNSSIGETLSHSDQMNYGLDHQVSFG